MRFTSLFLLAALSLSTRATAQAGAIEGLLKNVTDVNLFYQFSHTNSTDLATLNKNGARGFGFELSFGIGAVGFPSKKTLPRTAVRDTVCRELSDSIRAFTDRIAIREANSARLIAHTDNEEARRPLLADLDKKRLADSLLINSVLAHRARLQCLDRPRNLTNLDIVTADTTFKFQITEAAATTEKLMDLEFAIGYSQAGGYESTSDGVNLRTSVRELPSAAVYATILPDRWPISPYLGIRSGIVTLHSGRAYPTGKAIYTLQGQTFQLGGALGATASAPFGLSIFAEVNANWRHFPSVEWSSATQEPLPTGFPPEIRLNNLTFAFGLQFEMKPNSGK